MSGSAMEELDQLLPELAILLDQRLAVVGRLAESLEASRLALGRNDAEAIARGAAHQAELCRQWRQLEEQLRIQAERHRNASIAAPSADSLEAARSAELAAEWASLSARIRYLARVHCSLLRHMQRSLAVWNRVVAACAPTYTPAPELFQAGARPRAGE